MVIVHGARNRDGQRSEDYIEQALGMTDEYGNPFELIELIWRHGRNTDHAKTKGFEDAILRKRETGGLSIEYRSPGSVQWFRNLAGLWIGKCPKTPANMKTLAYNYYDRLWEIRDKVVAAEAKAMADKLEESLPDEMRTFNKNRRVDMNRSIFEKAEAGAMPTEDADHATKRLDMERQELAKKSRENQKRDADLKEREERLEASEIDRAASGVPTVGYTREALEAMHISRVKQILRQDFSMEASPSMTKETAINTVLRKQSGDVPSVEETSPPAETVTG